MTSKGGSEQEGVVLVKGGENECFGINSGERGVYHVPLAL